MNSDEMTKAPSSENKLKVGMKLRGTVKNLELYGAFVDIGTGQDALLHISQLGKPNVRNVEDVVKVGEGVDVYILKVDEETGRVALSLVEPPALRWDELQEGKPFTGTVVRVESFGVFVDIGAERPGMVHVSELTDGFVKAPSDVVSVGDEVQVRVLKVNRKKRQIDLTMKSQVETVHIELDEDEEEMPTAMAMAFRKAMEANEEVEANLSRPTKTSRKKPRQEQEDILSRTLRQHSSR